MPKAIISTYTTLSINSNIVKVDRIISEQENVPNIQKEVNFGKYSKKLSLRNKVVETESCLNR